MEKKIRWGIVGLGRIAKLFAEDLQLVKDAELVAVASNSIDRARNFAENFGVQNYYNNYENLFKDNLVDIVYVATLHHTHAEVSITAMNYGKHVLCEKPVAVSAKETQKMINASKVNKVFFMEAFWTRFNPSILKIKELIDSGEIGRLKYVNAEFTFYKLNDDPSSRSLNVNLAGGSLLDMGVYPIFLSYLMLGVPQELVAKSKFFDTGAEIQTAMIFDYPEAQAILYSGFANNTEMKAKICGEEGEILIHPIWHETQGFTMVKNGWKKTYDLPTIGKGFTYEILETHKCICSGEIESKIWSQNDSISLMEVVDSVRKLAGIEFPFEH
ncbi:Gfo/Idh/MocA family oxidoreductase [Flagellimonas hymeniacidonis]|uniref:Gfo/Idh/MocA family oxidoreductase n=1 Tax=Flagellimonas hymeniacidonis TaxID=2603628 RepID=A0A5C8V837_9FLAO|nr:Gfo/Idh/MocA family oxidoreductase [Flagellimonas hymeniacidonis]TXN38274.1 Gfo/Idh/MocA family oxidoreductase [Flagellimonas hymeniacidonis]